MGTFDDILLANVAAELATFGEAVVVYPATGASRSVTAIITRQPPVIVSEPRAEQFPYEVALPNSATVGISGSEWNNRFEIELARLAGGTESIRVRTVRPVDQDAAMITWGCR